VGDESAHLPIVFSAEPLYIKAGTKCSQLELLQAPSESLIQGGGD
jgi:hypothetical protein